MGYLKTCTSQSKQNALLNIRAIPLLFDENYLSWYHNEQIYHLKDYFLETFYYLCSQIRFTNNKNVAAKNHDSDSNSFTETKGWREQITDILLNMSPYAFEKLAQRLLRECGFSDVEVTKKSGDGGIDGTGKLRINGIFSFNVAFQCKRYKGAVGAPDIRDFRGSLSTNIEKGVLITTGSFTRAALEEASSEGKRLIDLMDGEELINKLAQYGIGLNEVKSYEVDMDFFNSLNDE